MRYDITNIPVAEVFEEGDGCPICRLRNMLEKRAIEYITGAAMMEPDIRQETNRKGFCHTHFKSLLKQQKRLPLALMLESHLAEVEKTAFATGLGGKRKKVKETKPSCYMCESIDGNMERFASNICRLWENEKDFRQLYGEQPMLCLPHCRLLTEASFELPKKQQKEFAAVTAELTAGYLKELQNDVSHFCKMFDYRNNTPNKDWGNSKDSIERTVQFLTGEKAD
jgi:hypothetical protein